MVDINRLEKQMQATEKKLSKIDNFFTIFIPAMAFGIVIFCAIVIN